MIRLSLRPITSQVVVFVFVVVVVVVDPFDRFIVNANYLSEQQDVDTMVAGLKMGLKLLGTNAFKVFSRFLLQDNKIFIFVTACRH